MIKSQNHRNAKSRWAGLGLTLLWSLTFVLAPMSALHATSHVTLSDLVLVVASVFTIARAIVSGRSIQRRSIPGLPGLILIVISGCLATAFTASSIQSSMSGVFRFAIAAFGAAFAVVLWSPNNRDRTIIMWSFLCGSALSAFVGLLQPSNITERSKGLAYLPNRYGLMCLMSIGLAMALIAISGPLARKVLYGSILLFVAAILTSGSRSATAVAPLVFVTAVWLGGRRRRTMGVIGLGAVALFLIVSGIVPATGTSSLDRIFNPQQSSVASLAATNSNNARAQAADQGIGYYLESPLIGKGFSASLESVNGKITASPLNVHQIYLQFLAAGGPMALAGFLYYLWCVWRRVRGAIRRLPRGNPERAVIAGIYAGYFGWMVNGIVQNQIWDRSLWLYAGLLIVTANSVYQVEGHQDKKQADNSAAKNIA